MAVSAQKENALHITSFLNHYLDSVAVVDPNILTMPLILMRATPKNFRQGASIRFSALLNFAYIITLAVKDNWSGSSSMGKSKKKNLK